MEASTCNRRETGSGGAAQSTRREEAGAEVKRPFQLVQHPNALSIDTVECLKELLQDARQGDLIGVAFCAMYRRRKYIVDTTGEAYRNPTFARGMVDALHDLLGKRARGDDC